MVKKVLNWLEDRTGLAAAVWPMLTHPIPKGTGWSYTLGSATLAAFIVQVITGTALALAYVPSASQAYLSLNFITNVAPFGDILRGMHYWGASMMMVLIGMHMAQVFLYGAYKFPREMNWLSGSALLLLTVGMAFTGQLLRWDQNAVWAVVVAAEQAGRTPFIGTMLAHFILAGDAVGGATLNRFFAIHVFFIPGLIFGGIALHLFLVLRNGISEPPFPGLPAEKKTYRQRYEAMIHKNGEPFFPDAAWRDAIMGLVVVLAIFLLALFFGPAPLAKAPNPSIIHAEPVPDWYFLWYFGILAILPHNSEQYFIIAAPMLWGFLLIGLPFVFPTGSRDPAKRPWAFAVVIAAWTIIIVFWMDAKKHWWVPDFHPKPLAASIIPSKSRVVALGAHYFATKGCLYCHRMGHDGGIRGPNLTYVGDRLNNAELMTRIMMGGYNMPPFNKILSFSQADALVTFLHSRRHFYNNHPMIPKNAHTAPRAKAVH